MIESWSRRRAAVAAEEQAEEARAEEVRRAEEAALQDEKTDAELLEELDLPDPDLLDDETAFKAFLSEGVPARLKQRALRRLWRINPVLANVDGLVEYGEDYTDAANVVENLQTAYQVGKGMLKHVEELARQAAEADAAEDDHEGDEVPDQVRDEVEEMAEVEPDALETADFAPVADDEVPDQVRDAGAPVADDAPQEAVQIAYTSRRMHFTFDDEVPA